MASASLWCTVEKSARRRTGGGQVGTRRRARPCEFVFAFDVILGLGFSEGCCYCGPWGFCVGVVVSGSSVAARRGGRSTGEFEMRPQERRRAEGIED